LSNLVLTVTSLFVFKNIVLTIYIFLEDKQHHRECQQASLSERGQQGSFQH